MRFSIRDLLWLTVVVALGVGWGNNYLALREAQDRCAYLDQAIDRAGFVPGGDIIGPNLDKKEDRERMLQEQAAAKNLPSD